MEYTIKKLAQMSGISTRTLRYYDEIQLLKPSRVSSSGYRIYGRAEVDQLQQILFYRELGVNLEEIKNLISAPDFDRERALRNHLEAMLKRKEQMEELIDNLNKTIESLKGGIVMSDKEKFEGFKTKLVDENEQKFGKEIREKYGEKAVEESNEKVRNMSEEQWGEVQELSNGINETLKAAMKTGDPEGELAQKTCELHKKWITIFWGEDKYSKEAHMGLGEMYIADERFKAYYDSICEGCAEFLNKALKYYCTR